MSSVNRLLINDVFGPILDLCPVKNRYDILNVCRAWKQAIVEQDKYWEQRFNIDCGENTFKLVKSAKECFQDKNIYEIFNAFNSPLTRPCCARPGDVVTLFKHRVISVYEQLPFQKGDKALVLQNTDAHLGIKLLTSKAEAFYVNIDQLCYGFPAQAISIRSNDSKNAFNDKDLEEIRSNSQGAMISLKAGLAYQHGNSFFFLDAGTKVKALAAYNDSEGDLVVAITPKDHCLSPLDEIHMQRAADTCKSRHMG